MKTTCIIALGSNTYADANLTKAREELLDRFPDITFGEALWTAPIEMRNPSLFLNQVAVFTTSSPLEEVKRLLRHIEQTCAQLPKDKLNERIYIDVDLLCYGDRVLKPEDMQRDYICQDALVRSLVR